MADHESLLDIRHDEAIAEIGEYLGKMGAVPMSGPAVSAFAEKRFELGWELPVEFSTGQTLHLAMLVRPSAPFAPPRIAVLDGPNLLDWPHLEPGGLLCVFPEETSFSPERPAEVARALLEQAVRLIEASLTGQNSDDFEAEFVSYWLIGARNGRPVLSLLSPRDDNRIIFSWRGKRQLIVADSEGELRGWLQRRHGPAFVQGLKVQRALLLWPNAVPVPSTFPTNGADLGRLMAGDTEALAALGGFVVEEQGDSDIIIGVMAPSGVGFGAMRVSRPRASGAPGRSVDAINRGFRPGKIPPAEAARRALTPAATIVRDDVQRADRSWIHGRDHDLSQSELAKAKVVAIGAGSLGSGVVELLAKSGIGDIYIVDPENLDWANLSRHALGASHISQPKSTALASDLQIALPHLPSIEGVVERFAIGSRLDWDRVRAADLIVATTGNWECDSLLNEMQQLEGLPPILYGWLESRAAAAHSVYIPGRGGCLRCGMSDLGRPVLAVTEWADDGQYQIPACGGAFTPYGAAELTWGHALVTGEALRFVLNPSDEASHKIWVGETARLVQEGGTISSKWVEVFGDVGTGGFLRSRAWRASENCPICGAKAQAA